MIQERHLFQASSETPFAVLSEDGAWQAPFALDIPKNTLLRLFRDMLLSRLLDEQLLKLYRLGVCSFVASSAGHEAAQVGVAHALEVGKDWFFPYYRDTAMVVAAGLPLREIFGQMLGTRADPNKGRQMPNHPGSKPLNIFVGASPIASHVPPAVGAALAMKLKGQRQLVMVSFGDGATSEGDFYAGANLAGARGVPLLMVCENNGYAISVDLRQQSGTGRLAEKAAAFGMPGYTVDGMDPLACYLLSKELAARARAGGGPAFVEMLVYRYNAHSSSDDDSGYRAAEEVAAWRARDPIGRYQRFLERQGLLKDADVKILRAQLQSELDSALKAAQEAGKVPFTWMFEDVTAELSPELLAAREAHDAL